MKFPCEFKQVLTFRSVGYLKRGCVQFDLSLRGVVKPERAQSFVFGLARVGRGKHDVQSTARGVNCELGVLRIVRVKFEPDQRGVL